jgi:hypothetical protein
MKLALYTLAAGIAVATFVTPLFAFGRGGGAAAGARVTTSNGRGGVQSASAARGVSTGPLGGVQSSSVQSSSRTGPNGASVQRVSGTTASRGPLGGASAGAASATRVTGPGGQSVTRANTAGVQVGPAGGVRTGSASGTAVRTPGGVAVAGSRTGVAVGPNGGVRTSSASAAAVRSPFGGAAVTSRTGVAVGPAGGVRVGHTTAYVSPNNVRASAVVVRGSVVNPVFTPNYVSVHKNVWVAPRTVVGVSYWRPPVWATTAAFIGLAATAPPVVYDYGSTVVMQENNVYVNGEQVATAEEYSTQASLIVDTGRQAMPVENDEWHPLGVFGAIQENEKVAQRIFQLAVNKDGIVRGNYYDAVADNNLPVVGSVDKKTQRVAWSIGEKKDIVFETGLSNLTKDESTLLVHYGKDNTQQMILVRLEEPAEEKK